MAKGRVLARKKILVLPMWYRHNPDPKTSIRFARVKVCAAVIVPWRNRCDRLDQKWFALALVNAAATVKFVVSARAVFDELAISFAQASAATAGV